MIILSKKKILYTIGIISMFVFTYMITAYNVSNSNRSNDIDLKAVETVALPVDKKVIILDARTSANQMKGLKVANGTTEAESNLKIALKLQNLLEQSGATVILTRSDDNSIYDIDSKTLRQKKISDIHNRVKIGNESSADIFVSIHLNKIPQNQYWGWQTFYKKESAEGQKLASAIQNSLNESIQKENTRTPMKLDNVYIIKHVEIPTTIVECGFLSNLEEEQLLLTDEYQNKLAWGIYTGIMDYFYQNWKGENPFLFLDGLKLAFFKKIFFFRTDYF